MGYLDLSNKEWQPGDWIFINKLYWSQPELEQILVPLGNDWMGGNSKSNTKFEELLSNFTGLKYFQTTNSGSAALEIAVQTLVQKRYLRRGDKVLHPALTFPTSIASAIMAGMIPVYADVGVGTYVISDEAIEAAFEAHPDIAAAIIPALLGNAPNIDKLKTHLRGRPLVIDSCDVLGTKWDGKEIGFYGDMAAYSFYGSHHISTFGVGGGLGTNNPDFADYIRSMTFWGRDFATDTGANAVDNFLRRYSYKTIGLDAQMSAVQAAFGVAQFERLPEYLGERNTIYNKLNSLFLRYDEYFITPQTTDIKADISWFCYPITMKPGAPFSREYFVKYLLDHKIEIRPIMAGNLTNHLPYAAVPHERVGNLANSDLISRRGFFIPCCPMPKAELDYYLNILETFLRRY